MPFADLVSLNGSVSELTSTTPIRMVTLTSINPKRATGNNGVSDLGGTDDTTGDTDSLGELIIDGQSPSSGVPLRKAACPIVNSVALTDTTITGTTTEGNNAIIKVYKRVGSVVTQIAGPGAASGLSVTINNASPTATWTLDNTVALSGGTLSLAALDVIYATAEVTTAGGTSATISGVSDSDCSEKTITASVCSFPVITVSGLNSGDRGFNGTLSAAPPDGNGSYVVKIYNAVTGVELTNIDGALAPYSATVTGTSWNIAFGGGKKVFSGAYTITMESAAGCVSAQSTPSFLVCNSNPGGSSTTSTVPTITDGTVLTTATTLNGGFTGGVSKAATVRLLLNNTPTSLSVTVNPANTAYSFDISSLTLTAGDKLKLLSVDTGLSCAALSAEITVTNPVVQSSTPIVTGTYCAPLNSVTTISGTSSEIGGTITLYTADTFGGTKSSALATTGDATITVAVNGNWSITTDAVINTGKFIFAKVQNTGETISDFSIQSIDVKEQTTFTTLVLTSDPITEGDASITGTSSGLATGTTIQLYQDGAIIDGATTTTAVNGSWTISGLTATGKKLFTNAVVTVKAIETGKCESVASNSKTVVCTPPAAFTISGTLTTPICAGTAYTNAITISATETGVIYQVFDQSDNSVGPGKLGTGSAMTISTDGLGTTVTDLKVKAYKIPNGSCTITTSTNTLGSIVVNPLPTVTLGANPSVIFNNTSTARNVTIGYKTPSTGTPNQYKIVFDDADFTASNGGLATFSALTTPTGTLQNISISIPLNKAVGVYTATFSIKEAANSCEKSYPITVTILAATAPTITLTSTSQTACSGSANFEYTAVTNSPTTFSIDFDNTANGQGFSDVSNSALSAPTSNIVVAIPSTAVNGTYNAILTVKTSGGVVSQEYPIIVTANVPTGGTVGSNQTVVNGNDVAPFTESVAATGTALTYQWQSSTTSASTGFSNIGGATGSTYDYGNIGASTTYFKRVVSSTVNGVTCSADSNVITVVSGTCPTITIALDPTTSDPTTSGGTEGKIVLSGLLNNTTYSVSYQKDGAGAIIGNYTSTFTTGKITINNLGAGAYTNIKVTYLSCDSNSLSKTLSDPVINTVGPASSTPTVCINTAINPNITHTTTGATGIANDGVSGSNGLPAGVSATWATNTITISGTPTVSGTFNYSILLTGGTGTVNATGTITVSAAATVAAAGTDIIQTANSSFTLAGNTATVGTGQWSVIAGTATITSNTLRNSGVTGVPVGTSATLRWTITNGACITTDDVVLTNNNAQSDLSIAKTSSSPTPNVGDNVTFTLTVTNNGPSDATGVVVNDLLPSGYTYVSDTPSAGSYVSGTGVWTVGNLTNGASATLQIVVTVNATGVYANTASIGGDQDDPDPTDDSDTNTPVPVGQSDLVTIKTDNQTTYTPGEDVVYTITVTNNGPSDAVNVKVVDAFPAGITVGKWKKGTGAETIGALDDTTASLANGATLTYTVTLTVPSDYTGNLTNVATITSDTPDPDPTCTGCTDINTPVAQADLSLNKLVDNPNPNVGDVLTFTLKLKNAGPNNATNVALEDKLPRGFTYVQNSVTGNGTYNPGNHTLTWSAKTIQVFGSEELTYKVVVNKPSTYPVLVGEYKNTAQVTASDQRDPNSRVANDTGDQREDDEAAVTINIQVSDLRLTKMLNTTSASVGDIITFTLSVENFGPSTATNVSVIDHLPIGFEYVAHRNGNYNSATNIWTIGSIASGITKSLQLDVKVLPPTGIAGEYMNVAEVQSADQFDPDSKSGNGSGGGGSGEDDDDQIGITLLDVDLAVTKTVNISNPVVNSEVIFTIKVVNNGLGSATSIRIEESLPSGYTYVSHQATKGTYDGFLNWNISTLTTGESALLTLTVTVNESGNYLNTANVISVDQTDSDNTNDSGSSSTSPICLSIYNEFSPNDDGVNDFFVIDCINQYTNNTLEIFNRWGNRVYKKKGYNNTWDGVSTGRATVNAGEKLPVGTYYYVLDLGDGSKPKKGWIYINR